jgi:hypothetical protein
MKNGKAVLCIVLMVSAVFCACAPQNDPESDFEASPQDGGKSVVITKYVGSKWEVRIPSKIQGLPVTHIRGFSGKKLVSVNIPNSVTTIGDGAFSANQLTSVTIPNSVTHIGQGAFYSNEQLTSITIGNGVTSIGTEAFGNCDSLTTINVAAGNSAYTAENGVLYNKDKSSLHTYPNGKTDSSFIIPNSVTTIGDYAFENCANLTSLTIPNSVTTIEKNAFYNCTGLTGRFIEVLRPLADIMKDYESAPAQERRNRYDDMLPSALTSQPAIISIFTVWKPNAIDGMDSRFLGRPGSTPIGLYAPVFDKENGRLETLASADVYNAMEYVIGPDARRDRVLPARNVAGKSTYLLGVMVPIVNPRTNEVVGAVGCYGDIR